MRFITRQLLRTHNGKTLKMILFIRLHNVGTRMTLFLLCQRNVPLCRITRTFRTQCPISIMTLSLERLALLRDPIVLCQGPSH